VAANAVDAMLRAEMPAMGNCPKVSCLSRV